VPPAPASAPSPGVANPPLADQAAASTESREFCLLADVWGTSATMRTCVGLTGRFRMIPVFDIVAAQDTGQTNRNAIKAFVSVLLREGHNSYLPWLIRNQLSNFSAIFSAIGLCIRPKYARRPEPDSGGAWGPRRRGGSRLSGNRPSFLQGERLWLAPSQPGPNRVIGRSAFLIAEDSLTKSCKDLVNAHGFRRRPGVDGPRRAT
jgi:hypothetical protein